MITPGVFFHFFKFLIFWVIGVKEQKMAKNEKKKKCQLHFIFQEAYIMIVILVHMCKMMSSPDSFFIFSKFWFSGLLGG